MQELRAAGVMPTPAEWVAWDAVCKWLEEKPYNASYYLHDCPWPILFIKRPVGDDQQRKRDRYLIKQRRKLQLTFWSTGHGWRLHSDYREKLAALAESIRQEAGA